MTPEEAGKKIDDLFEKLDAARATPSQKDIAKALVEEIEELAKIRGPRKHIGTCNL